MKIDWISALVVIAGTVMFAVHGAEDLWRRSTMRRMAKEFGLSSAKRLPEALSLYGTPFNQHRFTWNVFEGQRNKPAWSYSTVRSARGMKIYAER